MRELKLRYVIELLSDIGSKTARDTAVLTEAQKRVQQALAGTNQEIGLVERALVRMGGVGSASIERQAQYLTTLALRYHDVRRAASSAVEAMQRAGQTAGRMADLAPMVAAGAYGAKRAAGPFIRDYASLESANTDLKIALMQRGGKIPAAYGQIQGIAQDLGNRLPGTTKDYIGSAIALAEQGVSTSAITGGGLKSAAYLGVLLNMDRGQAAETVAKIREAYGLHDDELAGLANDVQKNKFAFGLSPEGIRTAASYSGAALGALDIRGRANMSRVLTLQGMANQAGMDPSSFGTNFAMMLTRLAQGPLMVEQAKKGMKGDARAIMEREGIKFDFFDSKGHLKAINGDPIAGMVHELAKLETVRQKLGEKSALEIAGAMFGQEAARPAMILARAGDKGYADAQARRDSQGELDERINLKLETFAAKLEALGGTVENVRAKIGQQTGEGLKPVMDRANGVLGGPVMDFFSQHPAAGTAVVGGSALGSAWFASRMAGAALRAFGGGGGAAAAAGAAGGAGAVLGPLAGVGMAGLYANSQLVDLYGALDQWYQAANRDSLGTGVQLSKSARARLAALPPGADVLSLSAPGQATQLLPAGGRAEVKVGDGTLNVLVHVSDDRITTSTQVTQQPSLLKINPGATNPAGYPAAGGPR